MRELRGSGSVARVAVVLMVFSLLFFGVSICGLDLLVRGGVLFNLVDRPVQTVQLAEVEVQLGASLFILSNGGEKLVQFPPGMQPC